MYVFQFHLLEHAEKLLQDIEVKRWRKNLPTMCPFGACEIFVQMLVILYYAHDAQKTTYRY